ncbi:hypothetical protein G4B88_010209 [Cannabis sativa]|uniref:Uncharacterized protein n=1 Tax=Cannabis sativa TaxID=3483 RepID=A0A7J6I5B8_CANSA|nr:hypothetical protein G4B88_010209 [Cannabis sativa]
MHDLAFPFVVLDAFFFYNFLADKEIKWYIILLFVNWRIRNITIAFQLAVFALICYFINLTD